jgi:hypothetical protein
VVRRTLTALCGISIGIALTACQPPPAGYFEFALVGDNPYTPETHVRYERLIDDVNAHDQLAWVLHVGDLKGGGEPCTDEELTARFELNQRFSAPFILTPGDNDWLDCTRESAGGFNEWERLDLLRGLFYPDPGTVAGSTMAVISQAASEDFPEFVENAMWERDGVVFATVHVNGPTEPPAEPERMRRKFEAAEAWIREAFRHAQESNAAGLLLAMQSDPWVIWGLPPILRSYCPNCPLPRPGLEWLDPALIDGAQAFRRPVVLAVGDTHIFRVDKPLYTPEGRLVENFTRVETFGFPDVHWVRVRVEPDTPWVFSFHQQFVE